MTSPERKAALRTEFYKLAASLPPLNTSILAQRLDTPLKRALRATGRAIKGTALFSLGITIIAAEALQDTLRKKRMKARAPV
jgi:hypothetical protein